MTRLSPEARALVSPAATFRALGSRQGSGAWLLARRPIALLVAIGSTISILAAGRLTARLVVDGAISFAFVPLFEIAALAIVVRRIPRRVPFAQAVDLVFAANGPWIVWMLTVSALASAVSPDEVPRWTARPRMWAVEAATAATILWFVWIQFHVFRDALGRSRADAARDVALQRAVAWSAGTLYFFGFALWPLVLGMLR